MNFRHLLSCDTTEAPFVIYADFEAINERYTDVNQIMINHIQNHIKSIKTVDMARKLSVDMMMSIVNQFKYIKEKKCRS